MARFVGRENVRKRLAPLEGAQGRTIYANGVVRIELPGEAIVVRPPFELAHEHEYDKVWLAPLLEALTDDHIVAALLVRLGGYAVGVFDGERLVASKVGSRFVKSRHKKGGSSANRFRRRREEQARALIEEAARVAVRVLEPWRGRVEFVALGGDREAISEVLATSPQLGWLVKRRSRGSSPSRSRVSASSSACPTTSIRPSSPSSRGTIDPRPTATSTSAVLGFVDVPKRPGSATSGRRNGRQLPGKPARPAAYPILVFSPWNE
jgi:Actinobacteria/chloroflexi VLRF1 release factor